MFLSLDLVTQTIFKITLFIKMPVGYKVSGLLSGVKCRSCINANVLGHHALEQKTVTDGN